MRPHSLSALHYGWVILVLATLVAFGALGLARFGYSIVLPAMQVDLGMDNTQAGVLAATHVVGYLIASLLGGVLAARFGPRRVIALGLVLAGCTVFPVPESPRLMELAPASDLPAFDQALPASLRVDTPLASDPLDSARILIKPSAYEYRALAGARWRESIPVVVRDHLLETFRASGAFANVMTDTSPATGPVTKTSSAPWSGVLSISRKSPSPAPRSQTLLPRKDTASSMKSAAKVWRA